MQYLNNRNTLFELMAQGATVITPNNRLSGALLLHYFKQCESQTVEKPVCTPYSTALTQAYQQLMMQTPEQSHPTLLQDNQCQHLWQNIIKFDPNITYSEGLLNALMQAWEHSQQWQILPENPAFHHTTQTRKFQKWWQKINKKLIQLNAITQAQLVPYLINANINLFTQSVIWVCFDGFTPQQLSLQRHLSTKGIELYAYDLEERLSTSKLFSAKDSSDEYEQLMLWLNNKIQNGEQRIGVVVPDLQKNAQSLQRIIQNHFAPELYNISLGQALSTYPLISHALSWLNLEIKHIDQHQISLILQSPYLGSAKEEFINRSQYMQDSALVQNPSVPLGILIADLKPQVPRLAELLTQIKPYPQEASPLAWVDLFQERLNSIGFPGDYGLHSENYQCLNRFTALFDELRQLNLITTRLSTNEALDAIKGLCDNTIFQAQKTNAPIHISGLLEASGCEFDSLWVMSLTDQCLPQKTRLSAFIPPQLQRDLLMPHCIPAHELLLAKQSIQRLQRGSPSIVFSFPRLQGDNPNLPCTLIADFPEFELLPINSLKIKCPELMVLEENYTLPLNPEEYYSGGTSLLANQAKCPFKAFAEHRLRAKPLLQTSDGLDNREKGQMIHKVMELLWQALESQKKLLNLSTQAIEEHINQAIHRAIEPLCALHPNSFPVLIQQVEYVRLKRLVLSYLEWEKQRPAFTVAAIEQSYTINLAGLDFKVRVDRLDLVEDKKWVIDYKSSLPINKPWNEDRPQEPQLLLYALLDEQINALLLVQLKSGNTNCSGLSEDKQRISGISSLKKGEAWKDYRANWHDQLTLLADEFQQGHCAPQPTNQALCHQCDFQNLCRFQTNP